MVTDSRNLQWDESKCVNPHWGYVVGGGVHCQYFQDTGVVGIY